MIHCLIEKMELGSVSRRIIDFEFVEEGSKVIIYPLVGVKYT